MVGVTKQCRNKDAALELATYLYYDADEAVRSFRQTNILPPIKLAWDLPGFKEPREYWSGQNLGQLYTELAEHVPSQYASPYVALAKDKFSNAVSACSQYYQAHGADGFEAFVRKTLKDRADDVRRQMQRNPF